MLIVIHLRFYNIYDTLPEIAFQIQSYDTFTLYGNNAFNNTFYRSLDRIIAHESISHGLLCANNITGKEITLIR